MIKFKHLVLLTLLVSTALSSCSKIKKEDENAEYAYTKAIKSLKDKRYSEAIESFEKMADDYPLSKWSTKGQVMVAYAHYKQKDYDDVIMTTESFISSNPSHKAMAYMLYLKSLSYYNNIPTIERGQYDTQMASYNFRELIARFPRTIYAKDGRKKLSTIDEHLAGAKMSVGRYSIISQNYIGAIMNFNEVVEDNRYRNTNQLPEAYFRLAEIYYKIGMKDAAKKSLKVLKTDYADNVWNERAKNKPWSHIINDD